MPRPFGAAMLGLALSPLLCLFGAFAAEVVWEKMNGVLGSSVLLDPGAKVDPSKQEIIWTFIASHKSPVTILHHIPGYMKRAEPSKHFWSRLQFNLSNGSLIVNGLKPGDRGDYSLMVDDHELKITRLSLFSNLSEALILTTSISLGSTIGLTCNVSGDPHQFRWWKDGGEVSRRHQLIDGNRTLVIPNASRRDNGAYVCVATNPVSCIQTHYPLIIPGRNNGTTNDNCVGTEQDGAELQRLRTIEPGDEAEAESAQRSDNGCARLHSSMLP
ncbi:immunoglobulin superfamily member 10-like isoform X2 [Pristis pectinata]|uniref:immunoglobulin superfamily member 10-like isoform X2 n=1 Tax=Pristis pectinata TaxID=685728 RepID=UPI00223D93EB|nr:immunoglobulin superfamily member 10-like isoform X2 [Pristis pectinata]